MTDTRRNFDLEDVNVEGVERIAEAVAKYDVDRFVHVSSYNADKNSPSEFFRTKVRILGLSSHKIFFANSVLIRLEEKKLHEAFSQRQRSSDLPLCSVSKTVFCTNSRVSQTS